MLKTQLIGLKAEQFRHPFDLEATNTLKQIPGLDTVVRTLLGGLGERLMFVDNIASSVRVSDRQLPHLHDLLVEACAILDLEPPQLYIKQHPVPNAYTFAMRGEKPFIVMHTSLVDMLEPPEIQAVIAHELGHLKCEHGVYLTLANIIMLAAGQIPTWGAAIAQGLQAEILNWLRCAEFTCDRAALLAVQEPKVVMSLLMKLSGGSVKLAPMLNLDAFLEQARDYEDLDRDRLAQMLKVAQTEQLTHPVPVLRAKEIDRWASSQNYRGLLNGKLACYDKKSERQGGWRNW